MGGAGTEGRGRHEGTSALSDNTPASGNDPRVTHAYLAGLLPQPEGHGDPAGKLGSRGHLHLAHAVSTAALIMQLPGRKLKQLQLRLGGWTSGSLGSRLHKGARTPAPQGCRARARGGRRRGACEWKASLEPCFHHPPEPAELLGALALVCGMLITRGETAQQTEAQTLNQHAYPAGKQHGAPPGNLKT